MQSAGMRSGGVKTTRTKPKQKTFCLMLRVAFLIHRVNAEIVVCLQLCRSSSGPHALVLCRGQHWSPRAWHKWCQKNPPPPPHASGKSHHLTHRPHTGSRGRQTPLILMIIYRTGTKHVNANMPLSSCWDLKKKDKRFGNIQWH